MAYRGGQAGRWPAGVAGAAGARTAAQPDTTPGAAGVPLDQRQGSAPIRFGLWPLDTRGGSEPDRAEVWYLPRPYRDRGAARQAQSDAAKATATGVSARSRSHRTVAA